MGLDRDFRTRLRHAAVLLAAALFLLTTLVGALALSVSAPGSVDEGETIVVTASGQGTTMIFRNGVQVANGTGMIKDSLRTNSSSAGMIAYEVRDSVSSETRMVEIRDVPLTVEAVSPLSDVTISEIAFSAQTNWKPELCYVNIDGVSRQMDSPDGYTHRTTFGVADGIHEIEFKCKMGDELAVAKRTVRVDTTPPKIIAASPSGDATGPYVKLVVDTDEIAQCRYAQTDMPYASMIESMGETFAARNSVTVQLEQSKAYTFFVRCRDINANSMGASGIISFLLKTPPLATVRVDGDEPLRAGTYNLTLKTNDPLPQPPKLTYTLQDSGKQQTIVLEGKDSQWSGYLMIPEDTADTVLSFGYEGVNRDGVRGTQLLGDTTITIDAGAPPTVDALVAENAGGGILLKWFSTHGDEVASYNIYRATREGVTYADFYTSTAMTEFLDLASADARYYYYRIAPIDAAGNIGELSAEVYGSAVDAQLAQGLPQADPLLSARLDEELTKIDAAMLDANQTLAQLDAESNPTVVRIIADMALIAKGREAVDRMQASADSLRALRARSPTKEEVDAAINDARSTLAAARPALIRRIVPSEQAEMTQPSDPAGLERSLPYAVIGKGIETKDAKGAYLADATRLQDRTTVALSAVSFTLYDTAGGSRPYTLVRKRITLQEPQNGVTLIESIPKAVSQDAQELTFSGSPTVLERDPVIAYTFPVLEQEEYTYIVPRAVPMEAVKQSRAFAYPRADDSQVGIAAGQDSNAITGQATRVDLPFIPSTDGLLIVLGIIVIVGLGGYYLTLGDKPFRGRPVPVAHAPAGRIVAWHPPRVPASAALGPKAIADVARGNRSSSAALAAVSASVAPPAARPLVPPPPVLLATSEDVQRLLEDAERHIDDKQYDRARELHGKIQDHLTHDADLGKILQAELERFELKMRLFRALSDAAAATRSKDIVALRQALFDARDCAGRLPEQQTRLIQEAKSSYAQFVRSLNTLEIEYAKQY